MATSQSMKPYTILALGVGVVAAALTGSASAANCLGGYPEGLFIDPTDTLWVTSYDIGTVTFFDSPSGTLAQGAVGTVPLDGANGLNGPTRIAINGDDIFVTNSTGNTLTIWNDSTAKLQTVSGLHRPLGVAVDPNGYYFIAENQSSDIAAFTASNVSLGVKSVDGNGHPFDAPGALAINNGNLYIATNDGTVHRYNESNFLEAYWFSLYQDGASSGPTGIAFDPQGNVYVSYYYTSDIVKYNQSGTKLLTISSSVSLPEGVAVEASSGDLYVGNTGTHEVTIYNSAGVYLGIFSYSCFN
jgi:streptogramin lyase